MRNIWLTRVEEKRNPDPMDIEAAVIGRRKPYHLQYAEKYKDNAILNPRMEGEKGNETCSNGGDIVGRAGDIKAGSRKRRDKYRGIAGPRISDYGRG